MSKFLTLCMISMLLSARVYGQIVENKVGFRHEITSQALEATMEVQVYLPPTYQDSNQNYPVLYLLDGQRFFLYGASLVATYQQYDLTPEFIVVGITTPYPARFAYFSRRSDQFIDFMEEELLPSIQENYRVTEERILFGWEYAGSLAFQLLNSEKTPFDGYLLASPFPIMSQVEGLVNKSFQKTSVYFTVSPDEYAVNHGVNKLDSILSSNSPEGLQWTFQPLLNEVHRSTPYPTLFHGIKQYFEYYPEMQVDNLERFIKKGAITYAHSYNQKRAEQYGFPKELSLWTRFTILRSAIRADDYERFQQFCEALELNEFYSQLSDGRIDEIAAYMIQHDDFEQAIDLYKFLLEKHPQSVILLNKIGNAYQALGQETQSDIYLKKAAVLSEQQ